ncbi:hypothetical protein F9C07_2354 [Aspergillus flavus]|uniref:Uncharacterized protein n=1 Tax=Aspergillus flavus (strain ATCC 200026 / FGSC A1120 / IAM 13836 / NRRL 3357 / JCM 12722 / SRRC 167) TaxID=332952 RepID=A0A7U2MFJ7_ASPFN|nr:hypothetical protein F9C07_2354 [Aspergillus flavus]
MDKALESNHFVLVLRKSGILISRTLRNELEGEMERGEVSRSLSDSQPPKFE